MNLIGLLNELLYRFEISIDERGISVVKEASVLKICC